MKRIIVAFFASSLLYFTGCNFSTDGDNPISAILGLGGVSLNDSATWAYSETNDSFLVTESVKSLSISGNFGGKSLYIAEVNTSDNDISSSYIKYISSANSNRSAAEEGAQIVASAENMPELGRFKHYIGYNFKPNPKDISLARSVSNEFTPTINKSITSYIDGTTTKTLYVAVSETDYRQKSATLRAHNDVCNVWVVDDYYTTSAVSTSEVKEDSSKNNGKVDSAIAQKFADAFEFFYPVVRNIFGNESDEIYNSYTQTSLFSGEYTTTGMEEVSDTGTKINIIVYDLFGDKDGGTLGFFSNGDYYTKNIYEYSNQGKYFNVDSYYAISEPNIIISTLVHEFQHMVHHGVKKMKWNLDSDTNFNEMLSMLCEDMMQQFLTENGFTIENKDSPKGRFLQFMIQYYGCGIRGYDESALAYANAYAFGSWLCRQYGGAKLVKTMMSNEKANNDCIVAAVNTVNDTNYTFNDLFAQFIKACYGKDSTNTFNKDADTSLTYTSGSTTYNYPMAAINLWESGSIYDLANAKTTSNGTEYSYKKILQSLTNSGDYLDSEYTYFGPALFTYSAFLSKLPPTYGMVLKGKVGTFSAGATNRTLTFSSSSGYTKTGMKLFLYIK